MLGFEGFDKNFKYRLYVFIRVSFGVTPNVRILLIETELHLHLPMPRISEYHSMPMASQLVSPQRSSRPVEATQHNPISKKKKMYTVTVFIIYF